VTSRRVVGEAALVELLTAAATGALAGVLDDQPAAKYKVRNRRLGAKTQAEAQRIYECGVRSGRNVLRRRIDEAITCMLGGKA
jgi:hypothetical protein